jgi:hypothetical protein
MISVDKIMVIGFVPVIGGTSQEYIFKLMEKRGFQFLDKVMCFPQAVMPTMIMLYGIFYFRLNKS